MSSLDRLMIQGIRSFDPEEPQIMQFYTPLTLIVGHNGSGKTTIIECLKYITTGDLPPNSKSGAFINDPKIAHETEVKAQIKLRFKNVSGKTLVATRSLMATQKKNTVQQKTLENVLLTTDPVTKEQVSISTRCSDLDNEIPLHLGVSKAILENVIFCHQDESLWPLSEPGTLKKKFDEIFAATRYTKALDAIKSLRKDKLAESKVDRMQLEHLKSDSAKAAKVREACNVTKEKVKVARARVEELDSGDVVTIQEQMKELMMQHEKTAQVETSISKLKHEKSILMQNIENLKANLTELKGTDEDLGAMMESHMESLQNSEQRQRQLDSEKRNVGNKIESLKKENMDQLMLRGQLQAEQDAHKKRIQERDTMVIGMIRKLKFRELETEAPLSDATVREFKDKLQLEIAEYDRKLEALRDEVRARETELASELEKLNSNAASISESKKLIRRQIEQNRSKMTSFMNAMDSITVTQADIDEAKTKLEEEERMLEAARVSVQASNHEEKIRKLNLELQESELHYTRLNDEISVLNLQADMRARLSLKKNEKERKDAVINTFMETSKDEYTTFCKVDPKTEADLIKPVDAVLKTHEAALKKLTENYEETNKKLSTVEAKFGMVKKNLTDKKAIYEAHKQKIQAVCNSKSVPDALKEAEDEVNTSRDALLMLQSASKFYLRYVERANSKHECSLCHREFETEEEFVQFIAALESQISSLPVKIEKAQSGHQAAVDRQNAVRALLGLWREYESLEQVDIPELTKSLESFSNQRDMLLQAYESQAAEISCDKVTLGTIQSLKQRCEEIRRVQAEVAMLEKEIKSLSDDLAQSGSIKTIDEVQAEQEKIHTKCQSLRREIERANTDARRKQTDLQMRENRIRDTRENLNRLSFTFQDRQRLSKDLDDLKREVESLTTEGNSADAQLSELNPKIVVARSELTKYREDSSSKEQDLMSQWRALKSNFEKLELSERAIQSFIRSNAPQRLQNCEQALERLDSEVLALTMELSRLDDELQALSKQVSEGKLVRRNIDDNLKYRHMNRTVTELTTRIRDSERELAQYDTVGIREKITRLKRKQESAFTERAQLLGELKQLEDQVQRYERELISDYKTVEEDYRRQNIKCETQDMALQDLEKYGKALDNAIMKYHSMKMAEINKIIQELWVNTYKGKDIDTIEIRADSEAARGNRSYNYRVVMIKGDSELDMRGRSSAGQKMLTSIMIRLALAETFGLNCGILALDEPTTNLDRENIESLAESLASIIKVRRQQSNFQLIVITHDEDFLSLLGKSEYADYYWRIFKDETGHSNIERQLISL